MYERIKKLCKQKGISVNKLEQDLEIAKGSLCKMTTSKPSAARAQKIAGYFGVSVDYLMTGKENNCDNSNNADEFAAKNEEEKELLVLCRQTEDMPPEYKERMYNTIKDTIDIYLKAIGKGE